MPHTVKLERYPDGNYWISETNEETGNRAGTFGPFQRDQLFHQLLIIGLDDKAADTLIADADANRSAEARGVRRKE